MNTQRAMNRARTRSGVIAITVMLIAWITTGAALGIRSNINSTEMINTKNEERAGAVIAWARRAQREIGDETSGDGKPVLEAVRRIARNIELAEDALSENAQVQQRVKTLEIHILYAIRLLKDESKETRLNHEDHAALAQAIKDIEEEADKVYAQIVRTPYEGTLSGAMTAIGILGMWMILWAMFWPSKNTDEEHNHKSEEKRNEPTRIHDSPVRS